MSAASSQFRRTPTMDRCDSLPPLTEAETSPTSTVYEICGLTLATNVSLPELRSSDTARPDCFFELRDPKAQSVVEGDWIQHWYLPDGRPWRCCAKSAGSYLLRFHHLADFCISAGAKQVVCYPAVRTPLLTIRHLLLDQVIPLCLNLRGWEAIHASAVASSRGVYGFVGETRAGKSTLAASLVTSGCKLLGDDCLTLNERDGRFVAIASYAGLRLWPDTAETLFGAKGSESAVAHYNQKARVAIELSPPVGPLPLHALFVLTPTVSSAAGTPTVERLSAAEGMMELVRHAFRLDVTDQSMLARQFRFFAKLIAQTPVHRLSYPHNFSVLPAVRQLILES